MQTRALLGAVLECDPERTRAAYAALPAIACACLYCRNYVAACARLPASMRALLESLGIDPTKEAEVYELGALPDGRRLYGGFYHLAGRLLQGAGGQAPRPIGEEFSAYFRRDLHLVPPGFPRPTLQLEFSGPIPWVLAEQP